MFINFQISMVQKLPYPVPNFNASIVEVFDTVEVWIDN